MATISVKSSSGADAGSVELADAVFGIEPNVPVMHQVVTAQLAAKRSGTQSTKTRAEVAGGGAKPWKQKGTGRARQGSIRSPQWKGGGVALGPKPRSYEQKTPKKMIRLALRSALSDRAADGKVIVVDEWTFSTPSTKGAVAALEALGVSGRSLLVVDGADEATWKSFRNLTEVHLIEPGQLNAYDVLVADFVVFTKGTLPTDAGEAPARREKTSALTSSVKATVPVTPPTTEVTDEDPTAEPVAEADDMASDLPNRPPSDPSKATPPIDPTDRVKSAADKPDPRFEAARKKVENQEALRAKVAKGGDEVDEVDTEAGSEGSEDEPKASGGFSFNQTTQKDPS